MPLTPRQRWLALFHREPVDRVPTDIWATPEVWRKLREAVGDDVVDRLDIDAPAHAGPRPLRDHHPDDPQANLWGVRHQEVDYGSGVYREVSHRPLAHVESVDQVRAFRWPSPDDYDYSTVTDAVERNARHRPLRAGGYEPFLLYCHLRGLEQGFEDLLLHPDLAEAILGRIFDFFHEHNRRIFEAAGRGAVDLFYLAEDLGSQHGPLFSLELYRRFLRPGQQRMAELAQHYGAYVFYHTDGAARPFLPDLVETVGIDLLNPLQWNCPGMELDALARDFGDRLVFHGGIDNQHTLPFGSPDEVRAQVRHVREQLGDARWICAPCHNLQAVTPVENITAMYEEAARLQP